MVSMGQSFHDNLGDLPMNEDNSGTVKLIFSDWWDLYTSNLFQNIW